MMKLIVYKPNKADEDYYKCSVIKGFKRVHSPKGKLIVKDYAPNLSRQLSPLTPTSLGKRVEIMCPFIEDNIKEAEEGGDATCIWYRNAQAIALNSSRIIVEDGNLEISNATNSDTGLYQVVIRNNGGEVLGHPTYLKVKDNAASSIHPSWTETRSSSAFVLIRSCINIHTTYSRTVHLIKTPKKILPTSTLNTRPLGTLSSTCSITITSRNTIKATAAVTRIGKELSAISMTAQSTIVDNNTYKEPVTQWTTEDNMWDTTERTTMTDSEDFNRPKRTSNDRNTDLLIWISAAVGGFTILSAVIISVLCWCFKNKPSRKQSFNVKEESCDDLEMKSMQRGGQGPAGSSSGKSSPRKISGADTKRLLTTDSEDVMYAPVTALDNIAADDENKSRAQGHLYDEPFKNLKHGKPYIQQLPTTPSPYNNYNSRQESRHSYIELLGPEQDANDVYAEPREGELNKFIKSSEGIYDLARDEVLTDTLRRITQQQGNGENLIEAKPLYHVLDGPQAKQECLRRQSLLYTSPGEILSNGPQSSAKDNPAYSEPFYYVLESSAHPFNENLGSKDIYGCHKADETVTSEKLYQPLMNHFIEGKDVINSANVYQALDVKARRPSTPSSAFKIANDVDSTNESGKRHSGYSENEKEDVYQPLNKSDRCPLDVSKPRTIFHEFSQTKRDSVISLGKTASNPSPSSRDSSQ